MTEKFIMFLNYYFILLLFLLGKSDISAEPKLLPKDGYTASQANMREKQIVTHKDFLSFHKICSIKIMINSSAIKSSP